MKHYIEKLNLLRETQGLSIKELGLRCEGLSQSAVKKILLGHCNPGTESLMKLCNTLGTTMSELFDQPKEQKAVPVRLPPEIEQALRKVCDYFAITKS